LSSPIRLLEKVTWRLVVFSIFLSSTFPRPIGPVSASFLHCNLPESAHQIMMPMFVEDENQVNGFKCSRRHVPNG
jgi:hypothetical protein